MSNFNPEILALEGFIRRAVKLESPFMLKGSFLTRQYFPNKNDRIPGDLDWVYLHPLETQEIAENTFNTWATQITEMDLNDGVVFRSFKENTFWRNVDYALDDDFPTTNTDLIAWVNGEETDLSVDISFNLKFALKPVSLLYVPIEGDVFTVPYSVSIGAQIAWKLHQTLIRPRFKDLFDLYYLFQHKNLTSNELNFAMKNLNQECAITNTDPLNLNFLLNNNTWGELNWNSILLDNNGLLHSLKHQKAMENAWESPPQPCNQSMINRSWLNNEKQHIHTENSRFYTDLADFQQKLVSVMQNAGLSSDIIQRELTFRPA